MPTDATGTPTSLGIRTYNTSADAPSGLGFNGAMADIDALLVGRVTKPTGLTTGDVPVWNGTTWVRPTGVASASVFLRGDGSWQTAGATTLRKSTATVVNTTVAPTDLLGGGVTVGAGAMGATGVLRLTASGDHLANVASAPYPRFQLIFGGVTIFDTGSSATAEANTATRWPWLIEATITNLTASTQNARIRIQGVLDPNSGVSNLFTTGNGGWQEGAASASWTNAFGFGVNSGLAVATGSAAALVLNVINGASSASYETKLFDALVEIL